MMPQICRLKTKTTFAFRQRQQTSSTRFTQYGIGFPMSKATAILRRNGTVVQMVGYLNFATFFMMIFCMPCFAFVAQFATGFAFAYIKQP
ncbi:hypothetical protein L280_13785 [Mannheimia haemolytica MhBrain2012]|nr:hypothetical protein L280_13785 [Mannheimia haemolytica MhBrain2012]